MEIFMLYYLYMYSDDKKEGETCDTIEYGWRLP